MTDGGIPEPIRRFLLTHVSSVEQLEVLLFMRSTRDQEWSAEDVNRAVKSSVSSIQGRLGVLVSQGFLVARDEGGVRLYRYQPSSDAMAEVIDGLAAAYRERRLAVIDLIYARPGGDAVSFANAFKVRGTKGDG